jgi:hypothetical protein
MLKLFSNLAVALCRLESVALQAFRVMVKASFANAEMGWGTAATFFESGCFFIAFCVAP